MSLPPMPGRTTIAQRPLAATLVSVNQPSQGSYVPVRRASDLVGMSSPTALLFGVPVNQAPMSPAALGLGSFLRQRPSSAAAPAGPGRLAQSPARATDSARAFGSLEAPVACVVRSASVERQGSGSLFSQIDADRDGIISIAEWNEAKRSGLLHEA